jgi:ketosteroid isomerase-like protein
MVGNPENQISADDVLVLGDSAVAHGSYSTTGTPEGEPVTSAGNWMARLNKVDGNWRWAVGLGNMDMAPPEDLSAPVVRDESPAELEESLIAELMGYYATHFNMGHAGMVASRYAEDAVAAISGRSKMVGRAAIEEDMSARMEAAGNPQLTVHVAGAQDLGDGYVFGGGWYETASDSGNQAGSFLVLARADDDGNMQIQWSISNGLPTSE